ncbi:hypothetical protein ACH427_11750 [Streptomyces sp. NPDC020379]|uniref:hypothetical protein n=1 Tax=Streptomyces sp. NPDC020379 TaxID=3365071 RepID=UPI00379534DB
MPAARPASGVVLRPLAPADAPALRALDHGLAWTTASGGGPAGLAASGRSWGASATSACLLLAGSRYEDIAVAPFRPSVAGARPTPASVR